MNRVESTARHPALALLSAVILVVVLTGPNVTLTYATDVSTFSSLNHASWVGSGFDAEGIVGRLYAAVCSNPRRVYAFDSRGRARRFATLPNRSSGCDRIAVNPAKGGGFQNKEQFVYVSQGPLIWEITPDGAVGSPPFTTLSCAASTSSITFDTIGSFDFDMIAACGNDLWRVDASGTPTLPESAALLPADISGPAVAPRTLVVPGSTWLGHILVASPIQGKVYAVSPGEVVEIAAKTGASAVYLVPRILVTFGNNNGTFFTARPTQGDVVQQTKELFHPANLLLGYEGRILVTSTTGDMELLKPNPDYSTSSTWRFIFDFLHANVGQGGGGSDFAAVRKVMIIVVPDTYGRRYGPNSNGHIKVIFLSSETFNATLIQWDDPTQPLRFGATGTEASCPAGGCKCVPEDATPKDGLVDLACHFVWSKTGLTFTSTQAFATGIVNPPFEGSD